MVLLITGWFIPQLFLANNLCEQLGDVGVL